MEISNGDEDSSMLQAMMSNHLILKLSALLFALFVLAEIIGAFLSGSLSLLGDASAMTVDVATYLANLYAEMLKSRRAEISSEMQWLLDIGVPLFAVGTLLGVTGWIAFQALGVIANPGEEDSVPVAYMFGFSITNLVIDVLCNIFFCIRGSDVFYHVTHPDETQCEKKTDPYHNVPTTNFTDIATYNGPDIELDDCETSSESNLVHQDHENPKIVSVNPLHQPSDGQYSSMGTTNLGKESLNVAKRKWNLNMWSAFAHVSGDTIRTISVLSAATISVTTGLDSSLCDAWAAIVCTFTIIVIAAVLLNELWKSSMEQNIR